MNNLNGGILFVHRESLNWVCRANLYSCGVEWWGEMRLPFVSFSTKYIFCCLSDYGGFIRFFFVVCVCSSSIVEKRRQWGICTGNTERRPEKAEDVEVCQRTLSSTWICAAIRPTKQIRLIYGLCFSLGRSVLSRWILYIGVMRPPYDRPQGFDVHQTSWKMPRLEIFSIKTRQLAPFK